MCTFVIRTWPVSWPGRGQDAQGRGLDALGAEGRSGPQRPRAVAAQRTALAGEMLQVAQVGERTTSLQPCAEQPRLGLRIHEPHLPASSPEDPEAPTSFGNLGVSTPARFFAGPCCGDPGIMSPNSCSLRHPSPNSCS